MGKGMPSNGTKSLSIIPKPANWNTPRKVASEMLDKIDEYDDPVDRFAMIDYFLGVLYLARSNIGYLSKVKKHN